MATNDIILPKITASGSFVETLYATETYNYLQTASASAALKALTSSYVGISNLTATGTPSSTTYLRGDNTWVTITSGTGSVGPQGATGPRGTTGSTGATGPAGTSIGVSGSNGQIAYFSGSYSLDSNSNLSWDSTSRLGIGSTTINYPTTSLTNSGTAGQPNYVTNATPAFGVGGLKSAAYPIFNWGNTTQFVVSTPGGYVQIYLGSASTINSYTIQFQLSNSSLASAWQILGSNDGSSWTILDNRSYGTGNEGGGSPTSTIIPGKNYTFLLQSNTVSYSYYKLYITNGTWNGVNTESYNIVQFIPQYSTSITPQAKSHIYTTQVNEIGQIVQSVASQSVDLVQY